jgi:hypothetical protein
MGAVGAQRVCQQMTAAGLQPIELERYSLSNKIWATKVKRLRLPDLLCVKTGLRVEVRAKSKLTIKMSDSPDNPDRRWNSGLGPNDIVAFILVREDEDGTVRAPADAELFAVEDLIASERMSRLGPAKSASEGAERDREWPSIVTNEAGMVTNIHEGRIMTELASGRRQTYQLRGKNSYVLPRNPFVAESQFLAGAPPSKAIFPNATSMHWNPRPLLSSGLSLDRYVGAKALGFMGTREDRQALVNVMETDLDARVALECAAALARLGGEQGLQSIQNVIANPREDYLRMEAILILGEFHGTHFERDCVRLLLDCARNDAFVGDEVRQAAIWGLGKDGLKNYASLLGFLDAGDDDELIHAAAAFGPDCSFEVAEKMVDVLLNDTASHRKRASASYVIARIVRPEVSVPIVISKLKSAAPENRNWLLATLGQMNPSAVHPYLNDMNLSKELAPLHLTSPETNWTRCESIVDRLAFVRKQTLLNDRRSAVQA